MSLNYLVYDLESRKRVLGKDEAVRPGEIYARSWGDRTDQGISVLCTMEPVTGIKKVFMLEDLAQFSAYASGFDMLVGYNIKAYDDKMIEAHGYALPYIKRYDLMHEIRVGNPDGKKSLKLDTVLQLNNLPAKRFSGADAPWLWQQGRIKELTQYCLEDVELESALFNKILNSEVIYTTPNDAFCPKHPLLV
jgi:hypothetical protein